jgi:Holliday junction resolvase-like predicted endonuclease
MPLDDSHAAEAADRRAAQYWLAGHPAYAGHDIAFDVVLAAPWALAALYRQRLPSDLHFPLVRLSL